MVTKKPRVCLDLPSPPLKTRKIRVFPANEHQREMLPKWFGTARWTYNQCLDRVKKNQCVPSRKGGLREAVVNNGNYKNNANSWVLETPRDIRNGALEDLINAYTSSSAKARLYSSGKFEMKFRSKKAPQQRIIVGKRNYSRGIIYPAKFGKFPLRSKEPLPEKLEHDAHLIRTRLGHYYLCIAIVNVGTDNQGPPTNGSSRIAAIDPGIRTPHTLFDPDGKLIEFGTNNIGRIYRLCHHLDSLQSKIDKLPRTALYHRKRWRMRRAWYRASGRIHSLVSEYHQQVIHYIVSHYDVILLPALATSNLVNRKTRRLTSKSARAMLTWSHYRFRQRLLWKCQTTGCKVVICDEDYTTKTCGKCGWIHSKLGSSKVFKCEQCALEIDRDVNGARNILLKNASRFGFRVETALGLTPASLVNREDAWPFAALSFRRNGVEQDLGTAYPK